MIFCCCFDVEFLHLLLLQDMVESIYRTKGFTRDCPEIDGAVRAVKELAKIRGYTT